MIRQHGHLLIPFGGLTELPHGLNYRAGYRLTVDAAVAALTTFKPKDLTESPKWTYRTRCSERYSLVLMRWRLSCSSQ